VLSNLYIASATLKRFAEDGAHGEDLPLVQWVCEDAFATIEARMSDVIRNLPKRPLAWLAGLLIFPLGLQARVPGDALGQRVATLLQRPGAVRDRLTPRCYTSRTQAEGTALFDQAMQATLDNAKLLRRLVKARKDGTLTADHPADQIEQALAAEVFNADEAERMRAMHALQMAVIHVDDFDATELQSIKKKAVKDRSQAA
jgi:acyl-CoA dehydrogenase